MLIYRLILSLAVPAVILSRLWSVLRGRTPLGDLGARFARLPDLGPMIWLHGASNGELQSARGVIEGLVAARPDLALLVSCNNPTARDMVRGWNLPRVTVRLAPIDLRWVLARAMRRRDLRLMITLEKEFWPNRHAMLAARGVPCAVIGGQISQRGAAAWSAWPQLVSAVFGRMAMIVPQDAASAARFARMGIPQTILRAPVDLKSMARPDTRPIPHDLAMALPERGSVILAASTHEGEEIAILEGFRVLLEQRPHLTLIIAPRHPRRADELARHIDAMGWAAPRRSRGEGPSGPVFLADTLGEMGYWYRMAAVTFVGGSLVARGGHTPYEPAAHQSAVVHGPHADNFAEAYARLDAGGGAIALSGTAARDIALGLAAALDDPAMTARATAILDPADAGGLVRALLAIASGDLPPGARSPT